VGAALADLDTTPLRISADAVLFVLVLLNVYLGFRHGFFRRLLSFAGLYLGCLVATLVGNGIASLVAPHNLYANAWAFVGVVAAVVFVVELLGGLYGDFVRARLVLIGDRTVGGLAGIVVGVTQASIVFVIALAVAAAPAEPGAILPAGRGDFADAIQKASLSGQLVKDQPLIKTVFRPVLPSNLPAHLAEGLQATSS